MQSGIALRICASPDNCSASHVATPRAICQAGGTQFSEGKWQAEHHCPGAVLSEQEAQLHLHQSVCLVPVGRPCNFQNASAARDPVSRHCSEHAGSRAPLRHAKTHGDNLYIPAHLRVAWGTPWHLETRPIIMQNQK